MTSGHFRRAWIRSAVCVLTALGILTLALSQSSGPQSSEPTNGPAGKVWGYVHDASGKPLPNASVSFVYLQPASGSQSITAVPVQSARTDSKGAYSLATPAAGMYALRSRADGYDETIIGPLSLAKNEIKQIDFSLSLTSAGKGTPSQTSAAAKQDSQAPEFFDEPQFTVAGVTQATNAGGHGSDTALRTTEALAKATLSLGKETGSKKTEDRSDVAPSVETEASLQDAVSRSPKDPALHRRLGDLEEKLGNPLEAVRQYQRAAELDPSEQNLFDWGAELLTHRALEPATEVFAKGNRLFPKSVRMLVALGVTWYARDSYDRASQCLENASDLAPDNSTPYIFLGKMLAVETTPSQGSLERLARFADLQPDNALANYYYAVVLSKQSASAGDVRGDKDAARSARVESHLEKSVHLDPKFGPAYLQLGIFYSRRADFVQAISNYRKAIEVTPEGDDTLVEAHYRLAQTYRQTGEQLQAKQELEVHDRLAKKTKEDTARERREVQEFVISLRGKTTPPAQP